MESLYSSTSRGLSGGAGLVKVVMRPLSETRDFDMPIQHVALLKLPRYVMLFLAMESLHTQFPAHE